MFNRTIGISVGILIFVFAGGYWWFSREDESHITSVLATRGDIIEAISVSGMVAPSDRIDLAFEQAGRIETINITVGNIVAIGDVLAILQSGELAASLREAEATLAVENAKLDQLERGTRPEEIIIQEIKVANAVSALADATEDVRQKIRDAYTKSDDMVHNKTDQFFENPSTNPDFILLISNFQLTTDIERMRLFIEDVLKKWHTSLTEINETSDMAEYITEAKTNLSLIRTFFDVLAPVISGLKSGGSISQTAIDGYRADISVARSTVSTASINLAAAEKDERAKVSAHTLAQNELLLLRAGNTAEDIAAQRAIVDRAEATRDVVVARQKKGVLRSPIDGTVSSLTISNGEIVSPNTPIISIITENQLEIIAHVPEVDRTNIEIGDEAHVTLDAYGREIFIARVTAIDPAETVIEGVPTYTTTLHFTNIDERVRPGMTANIDIITDKKKDVITVPERAIITKDGSQIVRIRKGNDLRELQVRTGIRGFDGNIEITEGITEGDDVVIFIQD